MIDYRQALPIHSTKDPYARRDIERVTDVILHHTAAGGDPFDFAAYHVQTRGWPGLAYHYMVDRSARVYYCNSIDRLTYHCAGYNTKSVGIALIGNYQDLDVSMQQIIAIKDLLGALHDVIGSFVLGYHGQYKPTLCPGEDVIRHFPALADKEKKRWILKV